MKEVVPKTNEGVEVGIEILRRSEVFPHVRKKKLVALLAEIEVEKESRQVFLGLAKEKNPLDEVKTEVLVVVPPKVENLLSILLTA